MGASDGAATRNTPLLTESGLGGLRHRFHGHLYGQSRRPIDKGQPGRNSHDYPPYAQVNKGRTYTINDESGAAAISNITLATEAVWLVVPDSADQEAIAAVVQAHDPNKSQLDARMESVERIAEIDAIAQSDWTPAQIRELIHRLAQELSR